MDIERFEAYWSETRFIASWVVFLFFLVLGGGLAFSSWLDHLELFGFPLGVLTLGIVSVIVVIATMFWFVSMQNRIDQAHGADEDL